MFEYKIKDLKYRINGLVPKDVCNYFIDFFIKNQNKSLIKKALPILDFLKTLDFKEPEIISNL